MTVDEFVAEWQSSENTILVHTSGSTGEPKPMLVSKERMLASAKITCDFLRLKPGGKALLCLPLDYIAGKMMVVRSFERGMQLVSVEPSNHPLATVADQTFNLIAMVPSQVYCSLQVEEERLCLMRARNIIIGGGSVGKELEERLAGFPNAVWSTYGMTETLSHIALRRLNGVDASQWYTPFSSVEVSLSSDGCLVIDAPKVCEERLTTNDIAEICSDGRRFRVLGRRDNVICSGGVKLQMEEIEDRLRPCVGTPFAVSKRKDEKFGEVMVLVVEAYNAESQSDANIQLKSRLRDVCQRELDRFSQPKDVVFVPQIPMTDTGKIRRNELIKLCSQSRDSENV